MFDLAVKYERPDLGDGDGYNPQAAQEIAVAKWTGELLDRNYPGHPWYVEVKINAKGGIIQIQLRGLMPADRWYVCNVNDVLHDPGGKRTVLKGAGEILERYNLPRQKFSPEDFVMALRKSPIIGRGHLDPLK